MSDTLEAEYRPSEVSIETRIVTFWDLVYRARLYLALVIILLLAWFFSPLPYDANLQWGLGTFGLVSVVTYHLIKFRVGLVIDTGDIADGKLEVWEPDKEELVELAQDKQAVTLASNIGSVVLLGGRFIGGVTIDTGLEEVRPVATKIHPHLEVVTNSYLADDILELQKRIIPRWLKLERDVEFQQKKEFVGERDCLRKELGLAPLKSTELDVLKKSLD